jgi:hypothetical protein
MGEAMNLAGVTRKFASKDTCPDSLAAMRRPDGIITCMGCGVEGKEFRHFTTNETTHGQTAVSGPDYFRRFAAIGKTLAGRRPRKSPPVKFI